MIILLRSVGSFLVLVGVLVMLGSFGMGSLGSSAGGVFFCIGLSMAISGLFFLALGRLSEQGNHIIALLERAGPRGESAQDDDVQDAVLPVKAATPYATAVTVTKPPPWENPIQT